MGILLRDRVKVEARHLLYDPRDAVRVDEAQLTARCAYAVRVKD
jgi:hypothetical protein